MAAGRALRAARETAQRDDDNDDDEGDETNDAEDDASDSWHGEAHDDLLWAQRSEYSKDLARTVGPHHPSIPTSFNSMEKSRKKYVGGPVDPNGRCKGRKLVLWHRPRMMEKLLLNIQYECFRAKVRIPWDEVVHRLEPGCSGPSAVQMLNKMRDVLVMEGHMIPPAMGNGIQPDPDIRGYVRDLASDQASGTRILRWTENYPNAPQSLSDSGFIRGSGNYRKVLTRGGAFTKIPRTIKERGYARKVIPEEAYSPAPTGQQSSTPADTDGATSTRPKRGKPRALWKKPGPKTKRSRADNTGSSRPSEPSLVPSNALDAEEVSCDVHQPTYTHDRLPPWPAADAQPTRRPPTNNVPLLPRFPCDELLMLRPPPDLAADAPLVFEHCPSPPTEPFWPYCDLYPDASRAKPDLCAWSQADQSPDLHTPASTTSFDLTSAYTSHQPPFPRPDKDALVAAPPPFPYAAAPPRPNIEAEADMLTLYDDDAYPASWPSEFLCESHECLP
ncbi:BgTH12-01262 [Blumeria graminis f. sp. triticale]|uniref:BgTH12-01262 n=1 Tax=Blumeria graminis f. sp. triticale TaxID=1689686 RepID=A0A9W4GJC4_BLUGR|nr:BgTH12-01262 [Blumeria graminis f. sp. triticale]